MTMDMTMDARSRKALEGLKSLDPLSNTCWRMMNGFAPEIRMAKLEGISQVLPYDYPLTVTTFWYWLSKATDFDAQQQFKRFRRQAVGAGCDADAGKVGQCKRILIHRTQSFDRCIGVGVRLKIRDAARILPLCLHDVQPFLVLHRDRFRRIPGEIAAAA